MKKDRTNDELQQENQNVSEASGKSTPTANDLFAKLSELKAANDKLKNADNQEEGVEENIVKVYSDYTKKTPIQENTNGEVLENSGELDYNSDDYVSDEDKNLYADLLKGLNGTDNHEKVKAIDDRPNPSIPKKSLLKMVPSPKSPKRSRQQNNGGFTNTSKKSVSFDENDSEKQKNEKIDQVSNDDQGSINETNIYIRKPPTLTPEIIQGINEAHLSFTSAVLDPKEKEVVVPRQEDYTNQDADYQEVKLHEHVSKLTNIYENKKITAAAVEGNIYFSTNFESLEKNVVIEEDQKLTEEDIEVPKVIEVPDYKLRESRENEDSLSVDEVSFLEHKTEQNNELLLAVALEPNRAEESPVENEDDEQQSLVEKIAVSKESDLESSTSRGFTPAEGIIAPDNETTSTRNEDSNEEGILTTNGEEEKAAVPKKYLLKYAEEFTRPQTKHNPDDVRKKRIERLKNEHKKNIKAALDRKNGIQP